MLAEKQAEYGEAADRLSNGLDKLQETNALVDTMQAQLNQLQPVLEEKAQACCLSSMLSCTHGTYRSVILCDTECTLTA